MSILAPSPTSLPANPSPPGREIGAETQQVGGLNGWASFVDEQEFVPELAWPQSIRTYHRMRSDSQVESLHVGTVQPIREYRWSIDPNKCPAKLVEQVSADLGLPIRGHEDDAVKRGPRLLDFDAFLDDALLAPLYGHFHHEVVGETRGDGWHVVKLAPRHPRTILEFQANSVGDLLAIRQNISGAAGWNRMPEPIPASKLIAHVWRSEAGSHVGRSLLRAIRREWLVKDRTIRVAAINLERGGGVPNIVGPHGASDEQLRDLAQYARQFKVAEGGGGATPFGSKLELVGVMGGVPDAVSLLKYCDEAMARVWALMLVQLGMTTTGNRALGGEFATYAARAQRAMAKWICRSFNLFLDDYVEYNAPGSDYSPLLHFESAKPDAMSILEMTTLIDAGVLTVDPELESWMRAEHGLPPAPPAPTHPELGDLTPEEVALVHSSRNPPPIPGAPDAPGSAPKPPIADDPGLTTPSIASAPPMLMGQWQVPLPDRKLRRQPTPVEAAARTDFRAMDSAHQTVIADVQALMRGQVIPAQVTALGEQIDGKALTKAAMAKLQAPVLGAEDLGTHLMEAARQGANAAAAELSAQGVAASVPDDGALVKLVSDQARAVAEMAANGISLSAQRRAQSLVGGGRSVEAVRAGVEATLNQQAQQWTMDQLNGAVQLAQNVGRSATFDTADQGTMRYYASELLDVNCCDECVAIDGTEYDTLDEAMADYAAGGYVDCAGGPRCRGTIVAVGAEPDTGAPTPDFADVSAG